jgi:APA family basic amino acid/polyamine antiporter
VLIYYGIANAAAVTLGRRTVPMAGLAGCLLLAVFLPIGSVLAGTAVIVLGSAIYSVRRSR